MNIILAKVSGVPGAQANRSKNFIPELFRSLITNMTLENDSTIPGIPRVAHIDIIFREFP